MSILQECHTALVCLVLLSLALLISLCLNIILYVRRKTTLCRDACCRPHIYEGESPSQNEGHYFHDLNHEQQENPDDHHEQQDNPIYGNISTDRRGSVEVCYETMTAKHTRNRIKSSESDLNYASLDLKVAKKRNKKYRHQQGQTQGRNKLQDQLPVHLTPSMNTFSEVETDMDAHLPPRDTTPMVSHSSIYLNSQQIAQETEDMERERSLNTEKSMGWEGIRRQEDGGSREQESEEITDRQNNGSVGTQLLEVEDIRSGTNHQHN
ncbi:hypothetical protein PAMA_006106 [Pampus argenteus]